MTSSAATDRRTQRTQRAISDAFRELVLSRQYDEIRVSDIADAAGIGRSTFYEHFRGKDEVLTHSITWLFEVLADAAIGQADAETLRFVTEHFAEQRRFARVLLRDRPLRVLTQRLAELIASRTAEPLQARGAAAAQLEILGSWLLGTEHATIDEVEAALSQVARPRADRTD